jgi:predicted ATPase
MARQRRLNLKMNKLYGRQKDGRVETDRWNEWNRDPPRWSLIEGHSGVGKSTLVQRTLAKENCFFCSGTFEQQPGSSPFEAIVGALSSLIEEICEEEDLRERKLRILWAMN